jgi:hypothetical protein
VTYFKALPHQNIPGGNDGNHKDFKMAGRSQVSERSPSEHEPKLLSVEPTDLFET